MKPPQTHIHWLSSKTSLKRIKKNIPILIEGDTPKTLIYVKRGALKTVYSVNGHDYITGFALDDEYCLNIAPLILRSESLVSVWTIEDSEIYQVHHTLLQDHESKEMLYSLLLKQAQEQQKRVNSLLSLSIEQGYRQLQKERPELISRVRLYLIAQYLRSSAETMSRVRSRIKNNEK